MSKPLIYIAGPYAHPDPVVNTRKAFEVGLQVYEDTGAPVIVPHLTLLGHAMFPRGVNFWYEFDLAQVAKCDAVYRIEGDSTGADREVEFAEERGIPVFYTLDDLARWVENGPASAEQQRDNWEDTARQYARNADYWRERAETAEVWLNEWLAWWDRWCSNQTKSIPA